MHIGKIIIKKKMCAATRIEHKSKLHLGILEMPGYIFWILSQFLT